MKVCISIIDMYVEHTKINNCSKLFVLIFQDWRIKLNKNP